MRLASGQAIQAAVVALGMTGVHLAVVQVTIRPCHEHHGVQAQFRLNLLWGAMRRPGCRACGIASAFVTALESTQALERPPGYP